MDAGKAQEAGGPDITLSPDGSGGFYIVRAATDRGRAWLRANLPGAAVSPDAEVFIAPAYVPDLAAWMRSDGLAADFLEAPQR